MVFSSPIFLFYFLPIILLLYFCFKRYVSIQNLILFIGSFVFYFWGEKEYSIIVLLSIGINYSIGLFIHTSQNQLIKKLVLILGLLINLSLLLYFKYYSFIVRDLLAHLVHIPSTIADTAVHLPLGISFFTFHGITFIVDIYRKEAVVSNNPLHVGLYTLFFPQLIAGPIVRYKDIEQQLVGRLLTKEKVNQGIERFIIGLAKKLIIANSLGKITDDIYLLDPIHQSNATAWLALICYGLQIYYDFSGYSDMAIGLAKMFGFEFKENFHFPYAANSVQEFWRRWHISLGTFFRDYVYKPLGGNRLGSLRTYLNLIFVFFLTGLWHGASWNFILWGLWHGSFMIFERLGLSSLLKKLPFPCSILYTQFAVLIGWVFFRTQKLGDIQFQLKKLFFLNNSDSGLYSLAYFLHPSILLTLVLGIFFSVPLFQVSKLHRYINHIWMRPALYMFLFLLSLCFLSNSSYNPFIYFRF